MKLTRKNFEIYLNEMGDDVGFGKNYGTKMRRNDPILFSVGYREWVQEYQK